MVRAKRERQVSNGEVSDGGIWMGGKNTGEESLMRMEGGEQGGR